MSVDSKYDKKVDSIIEELNRVEERFDRESSPTKLYSSKVNSFFKNIIVKFLFVLLIWILFLKYIGFLDPDILFSYFKIFLNSILSREVLIFGLRSNLLFEYILLWFVYMLVIDFPFVFSWFYFINEGKLTTFWRRFFKVQFYYPFILFLILTVVYFLMLNLSFGSLDSSSTSDLKFMVNNSVSNMKESQTFCILKSLFSGGDVSKCNQLANVKRAKLSSKVKYSVSLMELYSKEFDFNKNSVIHFDYKLISKNADLRILKFECYKEKVAPENLIDSLTFEDMRIQTGDNPIIKSFDCDLKKMVNPKSDPNLKVIPVIYFKVNGEVVMEVPVFDLRSIDSNAEFYKTRDKLIHSFSSVVPIISDNSFSVSVRWIPNFPLIVSSYESTDLYRALFVFNVNSINSGYSLGSVKEFKFTKFIVPEYLDYSCVLNMDSKTNLLKTENNVHSLSGSKNNCFKKLSEFSESLDGKSVRFEFPIYFKIKNDKIQEYNLDYLVFKYESVFKYVSYVLINFKNDEYIEVKDKVVESNDLSVPSKDNGLSQSESNDKSSKSNDIVQFWNSEIMFLDNVVKSIDENYSKYNNEDIVSLKNDILNNVQLCKVSVDKAMTYMNGVNSDQFSDSDLNYLDELKYNYLSCKKILINKIERIEQLIKLNNEEVE